MKIRKVNRGVLPNRPTVQLSRGIAPADGPQQYDYVPGGRGLVDCIREELSNLINELLGAGVGRHEISQALEAMQQKLDPAQKKHGE